LKKAEFDRYARDYEALLDDPMRRRFAAGTAFFHARKWFLLRDFLRQHGCRPLEMDWLDIGCGRGELLAVAGAEFRSAVGCDPSAEMAAAGAGSVVEMPDAERLPFADASFDLATAVCVYHHASDVQREALAREAARVLRPGGIFCIIEHNPYNPVTRAIVRRSPVDAGARLLAAPVARGYCEKVALKTLTTRYFLYFPERIYAHMAPVERLLERLPAGGQYAVFASRPPLS
jgi:SAM-dependent methyltransferase